MTTRARRTMAVCALALLAVACGGPQDDQPEIRLVTDAYSFRISSEPMPPHAREPHRWRVIVLDRKTRQPVQNGEGRIFATSRDGTNTWDGFAPGEEVGTYYGRLNFLTSGEWAMAVQFRADSTMPLQRVDWIQGVLAERPLGAETDSAGPGTPP